MALLDRAAAGWAGHTGRVRRRHGPGSGRQGATGRRANSMDRAPRASIQPRSAAARSDAAVQRAATPSTPGRRGVDRCPAPPEANGPELTGLFEQHGRTGFRTISFGYHVIRLWERPVEEILGGSLGILPLAPLANVEPTRLPQHHQPPGPPLRPGGPANYRRGASRSDVLAPRPAV